MCMNRLTDTLTLVIRAKKHSFFVTFQLSHRSTAQQNLCYEIVFMILTS